MPKQRWMSSSKTLVTKDARLGRMTKWEFRQEGKRKRKDKEGADKIGKRSHMTVQIHLMTTMRMPACMMNKSKDLQALMATVTISILLTRWELISVTSTTHTTKMTTIMKRETQFLKASIQITVLHQDITMMTWTSWLKLLIRLRGVWRALVHFPVEVVQIIGLRLLLWEVQTIEKLLVHQMGMLKQWMQKSQFSKDALQLPALPHNWIHLSLRRLQLKTRPSKGILYHRSKLEEIWILVEKRLELLLIVSHLPKDNLHASVTQMPSPGTTAKSSRLKETKFRYWLSTKWSKFESATSFLRCRTDLPNLPTSCVNHLNRMSIEDTKRL